MSEWFAALVALAMTWVLSSYLWRTLKSGEAVGLFFDFGRSREPVQYWMFSTLLMIVTAGQIWLFFKRLGEVLS